ncbi:hypothetical protein [Phenylobacterium sp.]|uniref:YkvI family membrane protein n=1 Tax=Phenylobacterium sp. TaxID=1871053 RepID=UPI002DEB800B|nr:hypothetical protein [Phenylobacterium sp.]
MSEKTGWFQRWLLPGLAFKAVVIGGGYATGRELASYFLPSGPWGGLYAMLLSTVIWSTVCAVTFLFALRTSSQDYRTFFKNLLGRFWPVYEVAYLAALVVILAAFAAAAGAIAQAVFGLPPIAGALALMAMITLVAAWGNDSVERLFKWVSFLLYGTYAVFLTLSLLKFGDRISGAFATQTPSTGWAVGGLTYAGYNIIGAIIILPVTRHLTSRKDAVVAGLLAGPLAMAPAVLFFIVMAGFYPTIQRQVLPSDFLLGQLGLPAFRILFQVMIFAALLESGTGGVHAINERIAHAYQRGDERVFSKPMRLAVTVAILAGSVFVADRVGLVSLIANGYRWLSYVLLAIYVAPLLTYGLWRLSRPRLAAG